MDLKGDDPTQHDETKGEDTGAKLIDETQVNVTNVDFAAALEDNKPNPWGKGYLRMYLFCALIFLCSTMNGKLFSRSKMSSLCN